MDLANFSNEFDILYNNITSNSAPALDEYEKSVFLTRAQEDLVITLYTGKNSEAEPFEGNEELRKYLETLVKPGYIDLTAYPTSTDDRDLTYNWSGNGNYYNYRINLIAANFTDILYQVYEAAIFTTNVLETGTIDELESIDVEIKPIRHTEYHSLIRNPFKRPNSNRVYRVDSSLSGTSTYNVELISANKLSGYRFRYIKHPQPIILTALTTWGLTINGISTATQCELPPIVHHKILERAVALASIAYKSS